MDIEQLLAQMTLDEKVSLLAGADQWTTVAIPRLGIPPIKMTDGPNGARGAAGSMGPASACFPVGVAMAATWNPDLIERVGGALAAETRSKGAHILLGPTVNIHRSPLGGRNFEMFSEDPYLSGQIAAAYIRGLQAQGVAACIKHYVCNDSEYERFSMSSEVSERALHEIYLEPFRLAVREARVWTVMSSYNKINGVYASENAHTLLEILKGEWGFDGLVISDWAGTFTPKVAQGGLDLEMPGPARWMGGAVAGAVRSGALDESVVDDKVRRLLRTIERVGGFAHPDLLPERADDRPEHRRLARETAGEAIVLLRNDGALPLDPARLRSIAVIGENARWPQIMGGGSSSVTPHYAVSPLDGIRERAGDGIAVSYAIGCLMHRHLPGPEPAWLTAEDGSRGLTLRIYDGALPEGTPAHEQVVRRCDLSWWGESVPNVDQTRFSARLSGSFTAPETGAYTFGLMSVGRSRFLLAGETVIDHWSAPVHGAEKQARLQLQAGVTYPLVVEFSWEGGATWRALRLGCLPPLPDDPIAEAVALAARSDVAIVVAGLTNEWETEGEDRSDMELRGPQAELIERVAAANPHTVVVVTTGAPVRMDWADRVAAVVQAWYGGQEAGHAIADVLFGDVNPSGRMPVTFPRRLQDNPAYLNYPGENGQVLYGEGIFVGYRYYDAKDVAPLYPFGHGLSYTSFAYRDLRLSAAQIGPSGAVEVSLEVENTGTRPGQEVVQLYVRDVESHLVRPQKELKAFRKVALAPGESTTVTFRLGKEALAYYDPAGGGWVAEPGAFEVLVGSSSRDIRLSGRFRLAGEAEMQAGAPAARLHVGLPLRALLEDGRGYAVLARYFPDLIQRPEISMALDLTLEQIASLAPDFLPPDKLKQVGDALAAAGRG